MTIISFFGGLIFLVLFAIAFAGHSGGARRMRPVASSLTLALLLLVSPSLVHADDVEGYVTTEDSPGRFTLSAGGQPVPLYVSSQDHAGVIRAARDLQTDLERVTGRSPLFSTDELPDGDTMILIGTIRKSPLIQKLVREQKLNVAGVAGKWETFMLSVVDAPLPGVDRALVIAGSDKRGTIYGLYDLAEEIGVSPWHYWADVPVSAAPDLYVEPGRHASEEPAVKYRGIFLNDENPALLGWVNETFGGFNHQFYTKVFELILRLKGNYLWPAMWGKAFSDDDPLNPKLADEYGIVMGTTHHEPMNRAHVEWERYGHGDWNYRTNADTLRQFWREGIERMGDYEKVISVGMRGDGDKAMTEGTAIDLLERIVADQRAIIEDVTGEPASETPQVWALYKEVQDYYDQGMEVPEDVTLLFADDNWGNIRRLPEAGNKREGGYGIYYHFDYVGGPRSYKWINTTQISRVWEQMHLAHEHGANRLWITNVGDLKPMEFPISFFLDYAWDPDAITAEELPEYTRTWAAQQFGETHADAIAHLLTEYTRFNSRRKPELLSPDTYSYTNYREAERVVRDYNALVRQAKHIRKALPEKYHDAFYQLVQYPVQASTNLNELYATVGQNRRYAAQRRAATNALADSARALFKNDAELTRRYHEDIAGGKWNHMMSQAHVGSTGMWRAPSENKLPEVETIDLPAGADMGVAIEGAEAWWPQSDTEAVLPSFHAFDRQAHYVEVFNRGTQPFAYTARPEASWLEVSPREGRVDDQVRLQVSVDWEEAPTGTHQVPITVTGPQDQRVTVRADVFNPPPEELTEMGGFIETDGYVSMEAAHFTEAVNKAPLHWQRIPHLGRTLSAMTAFPVTAEAEEPGGESPHLTYPIYLHESGPVQVDAYLSPTLNYHDTQGLRFALSIDDGPPQIVNMHAENEHADWQEWVRNNVNVTTTELQVDEPGSHTLKFWMVDPGVVLQKLVVKTGDVAPSYLGPPESPFLPPGATAPAEPGQGAEGQAR